MKPFRTLLKTELKLSVRGLDMVIFAVCLPVAMVIILGCIYGTKPAWPGAPYTFLEQSFGAVSTISICAGGVMGLPLLISDYRHKKVWKRFQVTPVSPALLLAVHITIYALYSLVSLLLVYAAAKLFFGFRLSGSLFLFLPAYILVMLSMFSVGMAAGGTVRDPKKAGLLASLLYFPMLLFSGATLPYEIMPPALQKIAGILPLTQGIKLLKAASLGLPADSVIIPVASLALLALVCCLFTARHFKWE